MTVENIMYFALGLLVAGLLALMIMPAVWRRAVRLTTKRIEAATPMTMAEFRADKDQLRAEFALSTRRLEMNVETLRRRLAEQLRDINRKKTDLGAHQDRARQPPDRSSANSRSARPSCAAASSSSRRKAPTLAQRLRMRDREYADKARPARERARRDARAIVPRTSTLDGKPLSGDLQHRHRGPARSARDRAQARRIPREPEPRADRASSKSPTAAAPSAATAAAELRDARSPSATTPRPQASNELDRRRGAHRRCREPRSTPCSRRPPGRRDRRGADRAAARRQADARGRGRAAARARCSASRAP